MAGPWGDLWIWDAPDLVAGQKYRLEIGVKMNTVVGPFDAQGNGTGNRGWHATLLA